MVYLSTVYQYTRVWSDHRPKGGSGWSAVGQGLHNLQLCSLSLAATGPWPHALQQNTADRTGISDHWEWLSLGDLTTFQPSWEEKGELFIILPR